MSAEVILMNKNGIAIAADSAVTIGNRTKIYNTADKMFTLSKYVPIGILIYNNSELMGIQIELIVKEYRKKLGDKKFNTLKEYVGDFTKFCIDFTNEHSGESMQLKILNDRMFIMCDEIFRIISDIGMKEVAKRNIISDEDLIKFFNDKLNEILERNDAKENVPVMGEEYYEEISSKFDIENIIKVNEEVHKVKITQENKNKLADKLKEKIKNINNWDNLNYSGIAITGYGEKEIFPSCIQIETLGIIDNKLIISAEQRFEINHFQPAQIIPLAQTDVMNEFFLGSNNEIENEYNKIFLNKIRTLENNDIKVQLGILKQEMEKRKNEIIQNRRNNIFTSLSFLPREEMIYMAEGMINLTSFKRRLVLDNYSQTVGGPIDLAYISKGDGFIWIKRKQYFDKDLNYVFTENYFKEKGDNHDKQNS